MASKKRNNLRAFSKSITPTRFIGILVLALSLPVTVYLVKTFVLNSSKAASQAIPSFNPSTVFATQTTPGNSMLSVDVGSGTLAYASIVISFDKNTTKLASNIIPTAQLRRVISITSPAQANASGLIGITLGTEPGDPYARGKVDLATLSFEAVTSTQGTSSVKIETNGTQFVDGSGLVYIFPSNTLTLQLNITPTPLPAITHQLTITGVSSNSNTVSASPVIGPSHNIYLASISTRPNVTVSSVTGLGLTWTKVVAQCSGRGQTRVEVWKAKGTSQPGTTVTANLSGTTKNAVISVSQYSGAIDAVDPRGQNTNGGNGSCSGGTDSSGYSFSINTSNSNMTYAAIALRDKTHTPANGFLERAETHQGSSGDVAGIAVMDKSYSGVSSTSVKGSLSGSTDWTVGEVELIQ